MPPAPPVLYKYCSPDRVDAIENGRIRFTQPRALNDPFEMIAQSKDLEPDELTKMFEEAAILCMSASWNSILMWSHYADSHRGFVLGLNTASPFFEARQPMKVRYRKEQAVIEYGTTLKEGVTTKYKAWEYEQEWRSLVVPSVDGADFVHDDVYLYKFHPDTVSEVIFGCLAAEATKRRVVAAVKSAGYKSAFFAATRHDGFRLERVPYDGSLCTECGGSKQGST